MRALPERADVTPLVYAWLPKLDSDGLPDSGTMRLGALGDPNSMMLDYNDAMRTNVLVSKSIPANARRQVGRVLDEAMAQAINREGLLPNLVPLLILNKRRYGNRSESYAHRIVRHCDMFLRRDFRGLLEDVRQATSRAKPMRHLSNEVLATKKVETGQVTAAMNALKSTTGLADAEDADVRARMDAKHPSGAEVPTPPNLPPSNHTITLKEAKKLLLTAARGKSSGPSRLTNEMLRETCLNKSEEGAGALHSFMRYIDAFTNGAFDKSQAPFINSARLIAKVKSENDERPIAIGEVLRRMACRHLAQKFGADAADYLSPLQVGFVVQGGAEATARGLNHLFHKHKRDPEIASISIDGKNAFNVVDRANMLAQITQHFPALARIAHFLYGGAALLYFGKEHIILSLCGTHQGCPLGGLFFALAIHPLLTAIKVRFSGDAAGGATPGDLLMVAAFYDNIYVVLKNKDRNVPILLDMIDREIGPSIGYTRGKNCFIVAPAVPIEEEMVNFVDENGELTGFEVRQLPLLNLPHKHNYVALGYPIGEPTFVESWLVDENLGGGKLAKLIHIANLVDNMSDKQIKLYLHTRSVVQHVPYLARILPRSQLQQLLFGFDTRIRRSLANIAGQSDVTDDAWRQAKLPYNLGGLQLQDPSLTADAAFLGSLSSFGPLTLKMLGLPPNQNDGIDLTIIDADAEAAVERYNTAAGTDYDVRAFPTGLSQKDLAETLHQREYDSIYNNSSPESKARLQSSAGLQASAIYLAVPNPFFGTKVPNHLFEKIVQFRLGVVNGSTHCSFCGHLNDANGIHQTTCGKSGLFYQRHNNIANTFASCLQTAGVTVEHEVRGMIPGNNQRPGDIVVHNFTGPGPIPFDVTVVSNTCATHIAKNTRRGELADWADDDKRNKYAGTLVNPLSFESHGCPSRGARWFMHRIAERMTEMSADLRLDELAILTQALYIAQKINIALQVGNARMLLACGNRLAARQEDRAHDQLAPMVDLRNVQRREFLA